MIKFLAKFDVVGSALLGLYASLVPACYVAVKMAELKMNEFCVMWAFMSMIGYPTFALMLFCYLANQITSKDKS